MPKNTTSIPINTMIDDSGPGIAIERLSFKELRALHPSTAASLVEESATHRHDAHSFFLLESGTVQVEIDFQLYEITAPSVIYVHPNQVHSTVATDNVIVNSWAITDENLNPEYLEFLEEITPAKPIRLTAETFSVVSKAFTLCRKFAERKSDKLYRSQLQYSCNALVALVISQYLALAKSTDKHSRFDIVAKAFRHALEHHYLTAKRPADYAEKLNISTPYLNECVKNVTGHPVSHHIHERVVLEAKRLLFHSNRSVKEIAAALGYDDYPYFSRLFTKVTGMSALAFRNKNLG